MIESKGIFKEYNFNSDDYLEIFEVLENNGLCGDGKILINR